MVKDIFASFTSSLYIIMSL